MNLRGRKAGRAVNETGYLTRHLALAIDMCTSLIQRPGQRLSLESFSNFQASRHLNSFSNLESSLNVFRAISQALYLSHIQTLILSMVSCTEGDLTQLYLAHRATLQEISVDTVNLIHAGVSWHSFLTLICDELQLARFCFEICFQDDTDICIQKIMRLFLLLRPKLGGMFWLSTTLNQRLHATVL